MRDSDVVSKLFITSRVPIHKKKKTIRPRDEVIDDESNDEMMMKTDEVINDEMMMKLL